MNEYKTNIARLWQRILKSDPKLLFLDQHTQLLDRNFGDHIAQPGYVGEQYKQNGIVFIGMNPGGGGPEGLGKEDLLQYEALKDLQNANDDNLVNVFFRLTNVLSSIMPTWRIFQNFVRPIINCVGLDFSQVAYLNLLKWRTRSNLRNSDRNKLYDISWEAHTQEQIELLAPRIVIAIGVDAGNAFKRHHNANIHFDVIPRVIGCNIDKSGQEAITRICDWLNTEIDKNSESQTNNDDIIEIQEESEEDKYAITLRNMTIDQMNQIMEFVGKIKF